MSYQISFYFFMIVIIHSNLSSIYVTLSESKGLFDLVTVRQFIDSKNCHLLLTVVKINYGIDIFCQIQFHIFTSFAEKAFPIFIEIKARKQNNISLAPFNPLPNISSRPPDLFIVRKPIRSVGSSLIGTNCASTERQTQFCTPRVTSTLVSTCLYLTALCTCFIYILEMCTNNQLFLIFHGKWAVLILYRRLMFVIES